MSLGIGCVSRNLILYYMPAFKKDMNLPKPSKMSQPKPTEPKKRNRPTITSLLTLFCTFHFVTGTQAQEQSIRDLDFLIGKWEVHEDNAEKTWWEKSTRIGSYTLDSTFIELDAQALSSTGKQRTYRWLIHYNRKLQRFEMVSMFSNWHKVQFDILEWQPEGRTLTIRHDPDNQSKEFHERLGQLVFDGDFRSYTWTGENKYGDPDDPSIWNYIETGKRLD